MVDISPKELAGSLSELQRKRKRHFTIFKKSSYSLKPGELMEIRPYNEYYFRREEDDKIDQILKSTENLLVLGKPLAGKTRAVYEAVKALEESNGDLAEAILNLKSP